MDILSLLLYQCISDHQKETRDLGSRISSFSYLLHIWGDRFLSSGLQLPHLENENNSCPTCIPGFPREPDRMRSVKIVTKQSVLPESEELFLFLQVNHTSLAPSDPPGFLFVYFVLFFLFFCFLVSDCG